MAKNKILYGDTVLIDLTEDTITPDKLVHGYTAHDRSGEAIVGTSWAFPLETFVYDMKYGYIANGTWKYEDPTNTYIDIYEVLSGHTYLIGLGGNVGSRFRSMFTTVDVRTMTRDVAGTQINNINSPKQYATTSGTAPDDGYMLVAKDNVGKSGIFSYVYDVTQGWL